MEMILSGEFEFVSIMGTQIMGTLQPYMALAREQGKTEAKILHTGKTRDLALRAQAFIIEKELGQCEIIPVSTKAAGGDSAPAMLEKIAQNAQQEGKRICFNTDGGLNFLIAACVVALEKYKPAFISALEDRISLYEMDYQGSNEIFRILEMPDGLKIEELLKLQGVKYNADNSCNPSTLNILLREGKIKRPANSMENVVISDIKFDLIWNLPNNRLCVIKDLLPKNGASKKEILELQRKFGRWSKDKTLCGQIFDKNVYALVDDFESAERLESASQKKIRVVEKADIHNPRNGLYPILGRGLVKTGKRILEETAPANLPPMKDNTLVTCVGTTLEATLVALQTHKPKHLLLCYTKGKEPVDSYANNIKKYGADFGLE